MDKCYDKSKYVKDLVALILWANWGYSFHNVVRNNVLQKITHFFQFLNSGLDKKNQNYSGVGVGVKVNGLSNSFSLLKKNMYASTDLDVLFWNS